MNVVVRKNKLKSAENPKTRERYRSYMAHISKDDIGKTKEDIEKLLSKHSKLIIKEIKRTGTRDVEIFLIEPTLPRDFKGFVQRLVMIVNEMGAEEATYEPENNSISFWYD